MEIFGTKPHGCRGSTYSVACYKNFVDFSVLLHSGLFSISLPVHILELVSELEAWQT